MVLRGSEARAAEKTATIDAGSEFLSAPALKKKSKHGSRDVEFVTMPFSVTSSDFLIAEIRLI
jgi:hypothetical protein